MRSYMYVTTRPEGTLTLTQSYGPALPLIGISTSEASRISGLQGATIRKYFREGKIRGKRVGHRTVIIDPVSLREFLSPAPVPIAS